MESIVIKKDACVVLSKGPSRVCSCIKNEPEHNGIEQKARLEVH